MAVLAFVLYVPGFDNGFAYDAEVVVEQDERIRTLAEPTRLLVASYWGFDDERLALYRPLVTLSYAVDWTLHGGQARGFHRSNALAHALAAALVFLVLAGLASLPAALAGAALFAAHPVHVEAVASIVGRADIFVAGFSFAALLAWSRLPARSGALLVTVPLLFLLALGSKESAIMLPALLVLFDAATGRLEPARLRDWLRERASPLIAMAGAGAGYVVVRYAVLGVFAPASLNPVMVAETVRGARVLTALQIWPEVLRLLLLPRVLLADYGPRVLLPADGFTPAALAGLALLAAAVGGGIVALLRGRRRLGLALLWTPVALFPVSNLVVPIGVLLAERTLYIAVFAVALGVAAVIDVVAGDVARRRHRRHAALAASAVVLVLFGARTVTRLPAWSSTDEVFRTLLHDRPDSYRAQWHHARMAWRDGDLPATARYYRATIGLWPHARPVYVEAGIFANETRQTEAARWFAERALEQFPDDALFLRRYAVASLVLADTAAARTAMERGLRVDPEDPLFVMMRASIGTTGPR